MFGKLKPWLAAACLALICVVVLAGCGGGSSSSSSEPSTAPATEEGETAPPGEGGAEEQAAGFVTSAEGVGTEEPGLLGATLAELPQSKETVTPEAKGANLSIDLGEGSTIEVEKGEKLKIGMFTVGGTTPTIQTVAAYAQATAEKYG